jgi:ABC-type glycerol-3-phosphate transport system substrate-binding protein
MIGKTLMISVAALAMLTACSQKTTPAVSATEQALCDVWQGSLPSRSRSDTAQTVAEIGRAYNAFEAACQRKIE